MNPYYAAPPGQPQPPPSVNLDDLFGGPSSPTPSMAAGSAAPPPPPPSYDGLNASGYGTASVASQPHPQAYPQPYAPQPPPPQPQPQPHPQQQQPSYSPQHVPQPQQQQPYAAQPHPYHPQQPPQQLPQQAHPGYYGGAQPPVPQPPVPQPPVSAAHSSPPAAPAAAEEDERAQLERIIRLRRELEQEQEREQRKKDELQTWGCTVCTFRNKLSGVTCEMCGTTRPGYTAPAVAPTPAAATTPSVHNAARAAVTAWQCGMCLAPNDATAERCKVCYAYRSSGTPVPTSGGGGGGGTGVVSNTPFTTRWKCSVCGEVNPPANANCKVCHGYQRNGTPVTGEERSSGGGGAAPAQPPQQQQTADPPPPTSWGCSVCTFENPTSVAVCSACGSGQRPRHLAPKKEKSKEKEKDKKSDGKAAKEWPCPTCTFNNAMGRKKCDMCATKRPEKYAAAAETTEARAEARREAQEEAEEVAWQDDDSVTACNNCHTDFTMLNRRHHCRLCGYVFCAHCSQYMVSITAGSFPQRVCVNCYKARKNADNKVLKQRKWLS